MGPSSAMSFDDKDRCMLCSLTFESTKEIKERAPGDRPTCGIFHACCYDMVEPELIETLTWVTSPAYETTVEEFRRRRQWLRRNLASQLHLVYRGRHLNADVCYEIAGHLLSCYSVMMARGMLPDPKKVKWFNTVTLAREMWCRRIDYEGLSYVAKLSSTRDEGDDSMTAIRCEAGCEPECLITAENYLGIVDVRLATYSELSALEEEPGIWWRTMPLFAGARITLETDVSGINRDGIPMHDSLTHSLQGRQASPLEIGLHRQRGLEQPAPDKGGESPSLFPSRTESLAHTHDLLHCQ